MTVRALDVSLPWLRWVRRAVWTCQLALLLWAWLGLHLHLQVAWVGALICLGFGLDLLAWWWQRRGVSENQLLGLMLLDAALHTGVFALSGGPFNPFTALYLVNVVLAAVVLSRTRQWVQLVASLLADPWQAALAEIKEGSTVKGKVVRIQPFGAFVELRAGIDGLIHISAMSDRRIAHPRDVLKVGDEVEAKVEKVDPAEKRIGLRLIKDGVAVGEGVASSGQAEEPKADGAAAAPAKPVNKPKRGQVVKGKVDRIESFGIFIAWDEANRGLIPASETGTDRGTDLKRVFPLGTEVKAEVIEIEGGKVKLSITAAQKSEERADLDAWKATQKSSGGKGFGTLADKLKGLSLK